MSSPRIQYNCARCPAYCCSYPHIAVTKRDLTRLAKHFGIPEAEASRKFTKAGDEDDPRVMRHKADEHFGTVCRFLDSETRECTIYKARPQICRDFPGTGRCGYYDFLSFERRVREDPTVVATTCNH